MSSRARPAKSRAPEPKDEEGVSSFLEGAIFGDFGDNTTWSALAGQVAIGFVPYAGQLADVRDLIAAGKAVAEGNENAGVPCRRSRSFPALATR